MCTTGYIMFHLFWFKNSCVVAISGNAQVSADNNQIDCSQVFTFNRMLSDAYMAH